MFQRYFRRDGNNEWPPVASVINRAPGAASRSPRPTAFLSGNLAMYAVKAQAITASYRQPPAQRCQSGITTNARTAGASAFSGERGQSAVRAIQRHQIPTA
ncbi:MAG: hypothetical protein IPL58_12860 [Betaproteobacteria bacterium]|uniref:Uncharacterized protein n=1 Tax=Candidatus Proximibacter danicus TaxID=2954365 RepID=A0A9D7PSN6_9PROT|nr:hypothetical protein [Candidatus Proximibacter danicus]